MASLSTFVGRRRTTPVVGPFFQGLIAAIGLGDLVSDSSGDLGIILPVAVATGLLAALVQNWGRTFQSSAELLYSCVGIGALISTLPVFLRSNDCGGHSPAAFRVIALVLLFLIASVFTAASVLSLRVIPHLGLGVSLYAALLVLQVLAPLVKFLDTGRGSADAIATALLIPAACALGWLVVRADVVVNAMAGAIFGMYSMLVAATPTPCHEASFDGVILFGAFCVAFALGARMFGRLWSRG